MIVLFVPLTASAEILFFTEVLVQGNQPSNSYIKIFNQSPESVDVSGFKIKKKSSTGKEYSVRVFPQGSYIPPYGYFLWANSKEEYSLKVNANVSSTAQISKNNSIALFSKENKKIDSLAWGEGINQFVLGDVLSVNPEKNEEIKRKKINGTYLNTKNNQNDFYVSYLNGNIKKASKVEIIKSLTDKSFPVKEAIKVAIFSALTVLLIKKTLTIN